MEPSLNVWFWSEFPLPETWMITAERLAMPSVISEQCSELRGVCVTAFGMTEGRRVHQSALP